ncbi:MAG: Polypeptide-transport-associated domain protein FtsQ-type [Acidimicrobiales bacterium]|nr:Polypeptide-transport-associated domain protein FtsQ-type [Acidimicrobiales bacterium]
MSSGVLTRGRPPAASGPSAPATAMDPRLAARRIEVARDLGRRRRRRLLTLALVTAVVLGVIGVTRSAALDVDHVRITGAARSDAGAVAERAGISRGRAMTSIDIDAATRRIEELPWVADARVARRWPGTVDIEVTERQPVVVAGEGRGSVLVDRDGRILGPASDADVGLPLTGPDPVAQPGAFLPSVRRPLVAVVADLPAPLRDQVRRALLAHGGYALDLDDGTRVLLGDDTRLRAKAEAVLALLRRDDPRALEVIDITVPGAAALTYAKEPEA